MCSDIKTFTTKLVEIIKSFISNCEVIPEDNQLKIVGDCIYCGRSKRGLPHLGIIIQSYDENKITGAINCFRCGTSKTLRRFLYDIKDILTYYKLSWEEIEQKVISVERENKKINYDFNFSSAGLEIEQNKFLEMLKNKFENNPMGLKKNIFLNLNAFQFIKKRLKLTHSISIFTAYDLLREIKSRCTYQNGKFYINFGNVVNYIFNPNKPERIELKQELDTILYGDSSFNFVLNEYIKKKIHNENYGSYYIIKDTNMIDEEPDVLNIYIAEGVFDALTMKYYKNFFNLSDIGGIKHNIISTYVAVCHYKINIFISKILQEVLLQTVKFPQSVKNVNFVLIPDLNMNPRKYVSRIYRSIEKDRYVLPKIFGKNIKMNAYYLDVFNSPVAEKVKDVNDIVNMTKTKNLKNVGLVEIF